MVVTAIDFKYFVVFLPLIRNFRCSYVIALCFTKKKLDNEVISLKDWLA